MVMPYLINYRPATVNWPRRWRDGVNTLINLSCCDFRLKLTLTIFDTGSEVGSLSSWKNCIVSRVRRIYSHAASREGSDVHLQVDVTAVTLFPATGATIPTKLWRILFGAIRRQGVNMKHLLWPLRKQWLGYNEQGKKYPACKYQ